MNFSIFANFAVKEPGGNVPSWFQLKKTGGG
jgi:hypothetical protein